MFDGLWTPDASNASSSLSDILATADAIELTDTGSFIRSGLRAARTAQPVHRRNILNDVSTVLNCCPEELGFLFMDPVMAANDSDPVVMPNFRDAYRAVSG